MMKNAFPSLLLILVVLLLASCADDDEPQVVVFAAASLQDVVAELAETFETDYEVEVVTNFAGSNVLAQQIQAAPLADIFLSADLPWVEVLESAGRALPSTRRELFRNRLVLIAREGAEVGIGGLLDLAGAGYRGLALADPEAVPAGRYARDYLRGTLTENGGDLWRAVERRVVPALDVRAALALVEADPEIVGIVYATDARASDKVRVLLELEPREDVAIGYWGILIANRPTDLGGRFLAFLETAVAREIIARHGFDLPE